MTQLTNEEKVVIVNQHLKNLHYGKFNIEIAIVEQNARLNPDEEALSNLNSELLDSNSRITALEAELDKLV